MSHLGRHRNDVATWRAYAVSVAETVATPSATASIPMAISITKLIHSTGIDIT